MEFIRLFLKYWHKIKRFDPLLKTIDLYHIVGITGFEPATNRGPA